MPGGFKWIGTDAQGDTTGKVKTYYVASGASELITIGDVVVITGDGTSVNGKIYENVIITGTAGACTGVVVGIEPGLAGEALSTTYHLAASNDLIKVNIDPEAKYRVDADAALAVANVGLNIGLNVTEATAAGGIAVSVMTADTASLATTSTLPFRLIGFEDLTVAADALVALVKVNETTAKLGATGIG